LRRTGVIGRPAGLKIAMTPTPRADVEGAWPANDSGQRTVFVLGI
jgi:hypothetical protein